MRKFDLFYKINTCLQKNYHLHWITDQANICKYLIYNFFSIWTWLLWFLFYVTFQKLQLLEIKRFWNNFGCIAFLFVWAQKVFQIFKILFQNGDINTFVLRCVFFGRYIQLRRYNFSRYIRYKAPSDQICKMQWLTSVEWGCLLNDDPKSTVGLPNSNFLDGFWIFWKKKIFLFQFFIQKFYM